MESAAGLIKLKPGYARDLEEWRATLTSRRYEVVRMLQNEGVKLEAWFQIDVGGEPYLLWFMHAQSIEKAREVFLNSTHDIDVYHLDKMSKMADAHLVATLVADLSPDT